MTIKSPIVANGRAYPAPKGLCDFRFALMDVSQNIWDKAIADGLMPTLQRMR